MKKCGGCARELPVTEFHRCTSAHDGLQHRCKGCQKTWADANRDRRNAATRRHKEKNADAINARRRELRTDPERAERDRAYNRAWRAANLERARARERAWYASDDGKHAVRKAKYGITRADWDALLEAQGNGCAICGNQKPGSRGVFDLDHDHSCHPTHSACMECIRGILCHRCNMALGYFGDNPALLLAAAQYLTHPPAAALFRRPPVELEGQSG